MLHLTVVSIFIHQVSLFLTGLPIFLNCHAGILLIYARKGQIDY